MLQLHVSDVAVQPSTTFTSGNVHPTFSHELKFLSFVCFLIQNSLANSHPSKVADGILCLDALSQVQYMKAASPNLRSDNPSERKKEWEWSLS